MFGSEQPSREELLALIESQARMIEKLQAEVAELKRRLGRNSGNSSQPAGFQKSAWACDQQ